MIYKSEAFGATYAILTIVAKLYKIADGIVCVTVTAYACVGKRILIGSIGTNDTWRH